MLISKHKVNIFFFATFACLLQSTVIQALTITNTTNQDMLWYITGRTAEKPQLHILMLRVFPGSTCNIEYEDSATNQKKEPYITLDENSMTLCASFDYPMVLTFSNPNPLYSGYAHKYKFLPGAVLGISQGAYDQAAAQLESAFNKNGQWVDDKCTTN